MQVASAFYLANLLTGVYQEDEGSPLPQRRQGPISLQATKIKQITALESAIAGKVRLFYFLAIMIPRLLACQQSLELQ